MSVPCGQNGNLIALAFSIRFFGINRASLEKALAYAETQIDPIKTELEEQDVGIAEIFIWALIFIVIFILIIFVIWVCYETQASRKVMIAAMLFILIFVLALGFAAVTLAANTVETVVQDAVNQIGNINSTEVLNTITTVANGAAAQYLDAVNDPCVP